MKNTRRQLFIQVALAPIWCAALNSPSRAQDARKASAHGEYIVYVGTYTGPKSQGIYAYRFGAATGQITPLGLVAETTNPSFLAVDPSRQFLYAVNEVGDYQGQKSGGVSAFSIDRKTAKLTFLNEVASRGADPCFVSLDRTGKFVLVANYTSGSVAVFPVLADGRLGDASAFIQHHGSSVNHERQEGPHAHMISVTKSSPFALVADLGLDELLVYFFHDGSLSPNYRPFAKVQPGSGPRHFAFNPTGKFVYLINEMSSTITTFAFTGFTYDMAVGELREIGTVSTLPKHFKGENSAAEIEVHPSGKFLYGSNRGHDSIAVFSIDPRRGTLTLLEHVSTQAKRRATSPSILLARTCSPPTRIPTALSSSKSITRPADSPPPARSSMCLRPCA